jgi:hypothetical protein
MPCRDHIIDRETPRDTFVGLEAEHQFEGFDDFVFKILIFGKKSLGGIDLPNNPVFFSPVDHDFSLYLI